MAAATFKMFLWSKITGTPSETMAIDGPKGDFKLNYRDDFVVHSEKTEDKVSLENSGLFNEYRKYHYHQPGDEYDPANTEFK